jgi:hypothetical protein
MEETGVSRATRKMFLDLSLQIAWSIPRVQPPAAEVSEQPSDLSARLGTTRVKGNAQPAVFNRQIAMYLAEYVGGWSRTAIGKFHNGRITQPSCGPSCVSNVCGRSTRELRGSCFR